MRSKSCCGANLMKIEAFHPMAEWRHKSLGLACYFRSNSDFVVLSVTGQKGALDIVGMNCEIKSQKVSR